MIHAAGIKISVAFHKIKLKKKKEKKKKKKKGRCGSVSVAHVFGQAQKKQNNAFKETEQRH